MFSLSKFLRSRYFVAALCILLEFVQILAVFLLLYEYFQPITVLSWIFYVAVLVYVINRDEIPEFKLPWMLILFVAPVIGAFVYILVSSDAVSKKDYARYEKAKAEIAPYQQQSEEMEQLRQEDPDAWLQANYLYSAAGAPCCTGSKTKYYAVGEDFFEDLLADLQKARKFIFMEYFIVQEGKMWDPIHAILKEKAQNGVEVYMMYDDLGCIATLPDRYYRQLSAEGIHCIPSNKFKPIMSHIHNNRDHRKIAVIDGCVGYTGGINLADEYINAIVKHGHWKDTAVRIEGAAVRNLSAMFLVSWNAQSDTPIDCEACMQQTQGQGRGYVIPFGDGPEPIYKDTVGKNVYLNMINTAKRYLYITTPYLICDRELLNALRLAARKGVDVRLVTPHIPDKKLIFLMTRSNYSVLLEDGVKIYEYTPGFVHAKNFLCDDKLAVCGTINLDYRSLVHHFECGAWMYDTECIGDMKADFEDMFARSQQVDRKTAALRGWQRTLTRITKVFFPLL